MNERSRDKGFRSNEVGFIRKIERTREIKKMKEIDKDEGH